MNKVELATDLHRNGYSCSQCVLMANALELGLDEATAARMGAGLGAGVASGEICGVASAMAIVAGLRSGDHSPASKKAAMEETKRLLNEFSKPFNGRLTCRDLKGKCGLSCTELIERGMKILN